MRIATYQEAATFLAMPLNTLYSLVHRKVIPHVRISDRMVKFDLDDLERWIDSHRQCAEDRSPPSVRK